MEQRALGRTGRTVPIICLGTTTWGDQNTEAEGHAQMDLAVERGVTFWDTAELYAIPPKPDTQGATERIIGSWLKSRGGRDRIKIATKIVGRSPMAWFRAGPEGLDGGLTRHTAKQIDYAVEGSLKRLGTDHIDLYQLHWPDRAVRVFGGHTFSDYAGSDWLPIEEILASLARHVEAGRIGALGLSNETPWGVMTFLRAAAQAGLPRIASIQNAYNLVNRTFEYGLAEIAMRENVGLLAYSPLAQGYLTGKYRNGALPQGSRKQLFDRLQRYEGPGAEATIARYLDLSAELGVTPAQLALKFCATRPFMTSVIIGATSMAQLQENLDAFDLVWTDEMEARVNALHAAHPNPCP